jgi:hypothetical protein
MHRNSEIPQMTPAERLRKRYAEDPEYREKMRKRAGDYRKANRDKVNAYRRRRYSNDSEYRARKKAKNEKHQRNRIYKRHGISVEEYEAMLARQQGACGICERPFRRTPCIDHCHATGTVRGLLCSKCNVGLGNYDDDPTFLRKAVGYLERWLQRLFDLRNREESDMISNDDAAKESRDAKLVRKAILHELRQPFGIDLPPPVDRLQAVVRALIDKAEQRDVQALKEVFDRIDGKAPSAPPADESPKDAKRPIDASWKTPSSPFHAPTSASTSRPTKDSSLSTRDTGPLPVS